MAGRTDFEQLVYQMSADIRRLETANNKALGIVNSTADRAQKRYDRLGAEAGRSWGKIERAAALAFGLIAGYSVKAASDAVELQNAFDKAFGAGKDGARAYAKTLSSEVGRSNLEVQEGLMQFRLLLKKLDGDTADAIAKRLEARAIDVGSLYNKSDQEVIDKFLSGISGESEPLKALGVQVNEGAVKLELLRLGFKGNAEQAPEAAKQIARANIILRETEIAAGDAADTLDSTANQAKRAKGEFRDAAAELGTNFLPIATEAAKAAGDMAEEFGKLPDSVQLAGLAILGLVVAGGPIARAIAGLQALIKWAGAARIAMATIGVGGVGKGGAGAVGVGLGVGTAIVAADAANQDARDDISGVYADRLTRDDSLETRMARLAASDEKIERALAWLRRRPSQRNMERAKSLEALQAQRAAAPLAAAAATPSTSDPAIGDFALPDSLKSPIAGGKKSGSAAAKAEAAANRARDQVDRMEDALAAAKAREVAAQRDLTRSIELRAKGALDDLDLEEAARNADLDRQVKDKALTQAQADRIKAAEALARSAERAVILADKQEDLAEADLRQSQLINDYYDQIASIRAGMARTEQERFRIEQRALEARQREERAALADRLTRQVASGEVSQSFADAQLAAQTDLHRAETEQIADAYTQRLSDGMQQAFESLRSKEDVMAWLADRFRARLADNLFDMLAKLLTQLGQAGSGGGGGGWIATAASAFAGLFAGGGTIAPGQWGVVNDGGIEAVRARPGGGIDVMNNGALRALQASRPGAASATRISYHTEHKTIDLRGAVLTNEIWAEIRAVDQRSAQRSQAVAGALAETVAPWSQSARAAETDSFRS